MKVLVVVHDYLPEHIGGTELHAHQIARTLAARGHQVTALFTERDLSRPEGDLRKGDLDGVRTLELVHQREYADVRESFEHPAAEAALARVLAEIEPDVVHFQHLAFFGPGALPLARRSGAAVVHTAHDYAALCQAGTLLTRAGEICAGEGAAGSSAAGSAAAAARGCADCLAHHPVDPARWGKRPLDRATALAVAAELRRYQYRVGLGFAQRVICPSRFLADRLIAARALLPEQVVVMKAGYPGPVAEPRPPRSGPLRIGYLGGLYPAKGVHLLARAYRELCARPRPAGAPVPELHVHGVLEWFPDYVAELRAEVEGLPAHFHGRFDPREVDRVFAGIDLAVVPSVWFENMPITIQEAFRSGVPPVVAGHGGMAEAVRDGVDGLHFAPGDAGGLAEALARLDGDRELLARLGRARPQVPGLDEIADRIEELYRACLEELRGGARARG